MLSSLARNLPLPLGHTRLPRLEVAGATAVVTGAASGMGAEIARVLGAEAVGVLVLVDRDADGLEALAGELASETTDVRTHVVDLSVRADLDALAAHLAAAHTEVALLVNNAGVALLGRFAEVSVADVDWVLDVNLRAPIVLTHALLPALREGSHVVNVSSLFGLIAPAGQSAYAASKFGLRGFSEVLGVELADRGVGVTTVHPGGIATRIAKDARTGSGVTAAAAADTRRLADRLLRMDPAEAARQIVSGTRARRAVVLVGLDAQALAWIPRLVPSQMRTLMRTLSRSESGNRDGGNREAGSREAAARES